LLLGNRERVRAAIELEEWARAEAMPSEEEIGRIRALIGRVETDLEQLSDQQGDACGCTRPAVRVEGYRDRLAAPTKPTRGDPAQES
jgi:hypothetical protein